MCQGLEVVYILTENADISAHMFLWYNKLKTVVLNNKVKKELFGVPFSFFVDFSV